MLSYSVAQESPPSEVDFSREGIENFGAPRNTLSKVKLGTLIAPSSGWASMFATGPTTSRPPTGTAALALPPSVKAWPFQSTIPPPMMPGDQMKLLAPKTEIPVALALAGVVRIRPLNVVVPSQPETRSPMPESEALRWLSPFSAVMRRLPPRHGRYVPVMVAARRS